MQLKRLHKNISEVGKRAYPKTKFPQSKQDGSELTPLEDYIENKLPRCPLYDQLREIRVPMGNYLDFSEVNETLGIDVGKIKMFPLDGTVFNNPISKTDHPLARTDLPNENRETDVTPLPKIDLFPFTTLMRQQLLLESHAYEKTYSDFQELLTDVESLGRTAEFAPMTRVMMKWFDALKMALDKEIYERLLEYKKIQDPTEEETDIVTFWTIVPTQKLTVIVCHEILAIDYSKERFLLTDLARKVADAMRAEYIFTNMSSKEKANLERYQGKTLSVRKINLLAPKFSSNPVDWSKEVKEAVGSRIIELLVECASYVKTVSRMEGDEAYLDCEGGRPFYLEMNEGKKYLVCEDQFLDFIVSQLHISDDRIKHYPMVVPPKPWGSPMDGGYFFTRTCIIRYLNKEQTYPLFARADQMEVIYEALNNLGATPWTLNHRILEVVEMVWYLGGGIVEVPPKFDTPLPPPPPSDASDEEKENYLKLVRKIERANNDAASLRGAFHLKLDCARAMKNTERFYYPYNMDFRGRVYPIPAHLNHIGSDMGRGLLVFADGKPLGARGFYWLQVHLANLSGQDKLSHAERVNYVRTHLQDFFDAADKPLTGKRDWMHKEDPWQYLAACFEFVEALRSPDPEKYICRLPVHQDGTCNGLQHYAALGGDEVGAISVNVLPGSYPQDVYSEVLKLVVMRVTQEANEGNEIAKLLEGKIKRAIVKQTIMTSVYGVTFIGAREQIHNAMKVLTFEDKNPDFPQERLFEATTYIARKTFEALGEMFSGARKIMAWLNHSANLVTRNGEPLLWITPLGLPVQQPYRKPMRSDEVDTLLQAVVLKYDEELPLNPKRNATAFPPNFVHSLDSTHMMLTALECYSRGIQYASVHDSYWTLPCHVDEMNAILREKFVDLYKKPILEQLREFWLQNDPYLELPVLPNTGPGFNLENVKKSPYFFH